MAESVVQGSIFEGLFERRLRPAGAFADELRAAGYDLKDPKPVYPNSVFLRCIEIAARHVHPGKTFAEASNLLGQELTEGFFSDTLAGKIVAVAIPMVGPDRMIKTLPSRMKMGSSSEPPICEQLGERHWKVTLAATDALPDLAAGSILAALRRTGVRPVISVRRAGARPELDITWPPKGS